MGQGAGSRPPQPSCTPDSAFLIPREFRVSDPDPDSIRPVYLDPDLYSESGSGSRRAKMNDPQKRRNILRNFMF